MSTAPSATFELLTDNVPIVIAPTTVVQVQFYTIDGLTALTSARAVASNEGGANWAAGIVGVQFTTVELNALQPPACMAVISSNLFVKRFKLDVLSANSLVTSALFIRDLAITELRQDRLVLMAQNYFPNLTLTDDFIWAKLVAAESETGTELRVPLVPTQFFATDQPTAAQLALVPPGMPIGVDPAQDYYPDFFQGEKWGFMTLRNKPVLSVQEIQFVYPTPTQGFFDFPLDWIRIDKKYAQIRFVPASSTFVAPLNAFLLQALGGGRTIPFAFNVTYQAGLNAAVDYPQLLQVIKRRAMLSIIEDGFLPSSGSISADGLSESLSINMESYRDMIDVTLNGPKGTNGGLKAAIHGVRLYSLGD